MLSRRLLTLIAVLIAAFALSACVGESLRRDSLAAKAKTRMIGMSKEDVLACMGPPKKKASEGTTDVWSYLSTDYHTYRPQDNIKVTSYYTTKPAISERRFCTVNVVMKNNIVTALHYLGPMGTNFYNDKDQCGYAVAACVE